MLPLGGFLIAIFIAYVWGLDKAVIDLIKGAENVFQRKVWLLKFWRLIIKYLAPILILVVLLHSVGLLDEIIDFISGK